MVKEKPLNFINYNNFSGPHLSWLDLLLTYQSVTLTGESDYLTDFVLCSDTPPGLTGSWDSFPSVLRMSAGTLSRISPMGFNSCTVEPHDTFHSPWNSPISRIQFRHFSSSRAHPTRAPTHVISSVPLPALTPAPRKLSPLPGFVCPQYST